MADFAQRLLGNLDLLGDAWRSPAGEADPSDPGTAGHAFLLGFHRSGTTLLEQVLKRHERVATIEERDLLAESADRYLTTRAGVEQLRTATVDDLAAVRQQYWRRVRDLRLDADGKVFVDKHPLNTVKLPLILRAFPDAKILFAIRDPRDVILSCFRGHFEINAAMFEHLTLAGSARLYDLVMQLGRRCRERAPAAFFDWRYEQLVEDFDGVTRSICDFLGIPWHEGLRDFAASARKADIRSPSAAQVRRGIFAGSVGLWRQYADELAPVLAILKPWIETFGYSPA
jgi:hypothetical protein